jgi:flagellar basal-body rod modification protein FlgD
MLSPTTESTFAFNALKQGTASRGRIMEVTGTSNTTGTGSNSASSLTQLSQDLDNFLTILTTQLQYQDPLSPMDTHEFTNQLVQFAGVEQSIQQNKNLESLIALQETDIMVGAVSYIGKEVEVTGQTTKLEDGSATFSYEMPEDAAAAIMAIYDADGTQVYAGKAETAAGRHSFVWDGVASSGETMEDGYYTIQIAAANEDGEQINPTYTVRGMVTGVGIEDGTPFLDFDGQQVALANVVRVVEPEGETD